MPHYKYFILLLYSCFGYVEDDNQRGLGQRNEIEGKEKEKKIFHHASPIETIEANVDHG